MHLEPACLTLPESPGHVGESLAQPGWDRGPTVGLGPLSAARVQRKVPPQVAGTWHVVAMAASDMSLLDAESGLLRVYVQELKPTPQGDLGVLLQERWVSPTTNV